MKRGEVWWIRENPSAGPAIRKRCAAVIVSNDASNKSLNRVQVVPLTGGTDYVYPSEAQVTCNGKKCKVMADQLATINKSRLFLCGGCLSEEDMSRVEGAIKVQLNLY